MAAGFLDGGLDAPTADEPAQDVHRVGVQVGAQEGLWLFLTLWIAHQHPADRHLHAGVMPERGAGGDVEPALAPAIPAIDPDPAPGCGGIGQPPRQGRGAGALSPWACGGGGRLCPVVVRACRASGVGPARTGRRQASAARSCTGAGPPRARVRWRKSCCPPLRSRAVLAASERSGAAPAGPSRSASYAGGLVQWQSVLRARAWSGRAEPTRNRPTGSERAASRRASAGRWL